MIRCRLCFQYGHKARWCLSRKKPQAVWKPKRTLLPTITELDSTRNSYKNKDPATPLHPESASSLRKSSEAQECINPDGNDKICEAMENFPVNPNLFTPEGFNVQDGWHRPARGQMALGGEPPRLHEDYGIVTLEPMVEEEHLAEALAEAIDFMEHHHDIRILTSCLSPLG